MTLFEIKFADCLLVGSTIFHFLSVIYSDNTVAMDLWSTNREQPTAAQSITWRRLNPRVVEQG